MQRSIWLHKLRILSRLERIPIWCMVIVMNLVRDKVTCCCQPCHRPRLTCRGCLTMVQGWPVGQVLLIRTNLTIKICRLSLARVRIRIIRISMWMLNCGWISIWLKGWLGTRKVLFAYNLTNGRNGEDLMSLFMIIIQVNKPVIWIEEQTVWR